MPGEFVICPDCQGWPSCETGMQCLTCGDDGQIWNEEPDGDDDPAVADGWLPDGSWKP